MALKLNSASGSITLTAEDGSGNVDISIPRAGFAATDPQLTDLAGLTPSDGEFIVGDGTNFVTESGATARTSLGLGSTATQDSTSISFTGGTIDGTVIGGTTPAAGSFTTLGSTVSGTDVGVTVTNSGTGNGVYIDQNGNGRGLAIDSAATTQTALHIDTAVTTGNGLDILPSAITTGYAQRIYINNATFSGQALRIHNDHASSNGTGLYMINDGSGNALVIDNNGSGNALYTDGGNVVINNGNLSTPNGSVSDQHGNVRDVPTFGTATASYTLQASDAGRMVEIGTGGSITVPTGVFGVGDVVTIVNQTASTASITTSALTAYISGDTTAKSSVTIDGRGLCTLLFTDTTLVYLSGNIS